MKSVIVVRDGDQINIYNDLRTACEFLELNYMSLMQKRFKAFKVGETRTHDGREFSKQQIIVKDTGKPRGNPNPTVNGKIKPKAKKPDNILDFTRR